MYIVDVTGRERGQQEMPEGMEGVAVAVREAYKRHGAASPILNGLNMTVKEGNM